ncbi:MAG TPA: hypothetical protein VGC49_01270 [Solirubrobacterales bacterium]|jgi:hypothetical protein
MPTYIRFGDDHSVAVQEELAEIRGLIEASESRNPPLFETTRIDGAKMLVNASEVWTLTEGKKKDAGGKR